MPDPYFAMEFAAARAQAIRVPCRYCAAEIGQACVNLITRQENTRIVAHEGRVLDAKAQL